MRLGNYVVGAGKLVLLLGLLGATFVGSAVVSMQMAFRTREVEVPTLVGATVTDATSRLAALGLSVNVDPNRRRSDDVPANRIAQQDPPAGVRARPGRAVRVWLNDDGTGVRIPNLAGQAERSTMLRLPEDGLVVGEVAEIRSSDYGTDEIVAQDPPPGAAGGTVSLLVNRGERAATYIMPDLIGLPGAAVAEALRARGFRITIVGSQPYPGVPPGTVVRQQPQGGFQVSQSFAVSIEVSQ